MNDVDETPETEAPAVPDSVVRGTADETPAVAIGGTALVIVALVALALGVAALAYLLAG